MLQYFPLGLASLSPLYIPAPLVVAEPRFQGECIPRVGITGVSQVLERKGIAVDHTGYIPHLVPQFDHLVAAGVHESQQLTPSRPMRPAASDQLICGFRADQNHLEMEAITPSMLDGKVLRTIRIGHPLRALTGAERLIAQATSIRQWRSRCLRRPRRR